MLVLIENMFVFADHMYIYILYIYTVFNTFLLPTITIHIMKQQLLYFILISSYMMRPKNFKIYYLPECFVFLFINSLFISLFYSYQAPNLKPLQVSVSRQRAVFCSMKNCITKLGSFTYFSFYFFLFKLQFLWQKLLIDAYFFVILM